MQTASCQNTGVHHVGLFAKDPAASARFYCDILGMEVVGGSEADHPLGASAFLCSRSAQESHEIALFANPMLRHVAFKVSSLAELRRLHAGVLARKLTVKFAFNHGVSLAFYFEDPDGNMIEGYWPTGKDCPQPHALPVDLTQPDEVLLGQVRAGVGG